MCNCGKKRSDYSVAQSSGTSAHTNTVLAKNELWNDIYFEYTGLTGLSVTGGVSGKKYRFPEPGNVQSVDYRDASGMLTIPVLKRVNR